MSLNGAVISTSIRIVKRGKQNPASTDRATNAKRDNNRAITTTVKSWIAEMRLRKMQPVRGFAVK